MKISTKNLVVWGGIILSIVSLYLAFAGQKIDWGLVWVSMGQIDWFWIILTIIPFWLTIAGKVFRHQVLLYPDKPPLGKLSNGLLISYLFNTALPARPGEVIRAYYIGETTAISKVRVLSTIFVEKVLDILTLVIILALVLPFAPFPAELRGLVISLTITIVALFIVILALAVKPVVAQRLIGALAKRLPASLGSKVVGLVEQVLNGMTPLANPRLAPALIFWSFFTWIMNAGTTLTVIVAFHLSVPIITAALLLTVLFNLGLSIPTPAGVGPFEFITTRVIGGVFNVEDKNLVTAFTVVLHIIGFGPLVVVGFIVMLREGLSWGKLTQMGEQEKALEAKALEEGVGGLG